MLMSKLQGAHPSRACLAMLGPQELTQCTLAMVGAQCVMHSAKQLDWGLCIFYTLSVLHEDLPMVSL